MNTNRLSYLDNLRISGGTERVRQVFGGLVRRDRREALMQLCNKSLQFPTFFILLHDIAAFELTSELDPQKKAAVHICNKKIILPGLNPSDIETQQGEILYKALLWMFDTGKLWGGPGGGRDGFDSVMDYVSARLILDFDEKTVLPDVVELIFRRNRRGLLIHDLVWCFFQTLGHDSLTKTAGYLMSSNPKDRELACKMLHLEIGAVPDRAEAKELYDYFINWLNDNKPYLYLTGEHFQMTSNPMHLSCDLEAKYLNKEISPRYRAPIEPLSENEADCLRAFREVPTNEQRLLTDYSHTLRRLDARLWDEWMHKQVAEQVIAARKGYEAV